MIVGLIGIFTNTFNILVLSKQRLQEQSNIVFLALSVADLHFSMTETVLNRMAQISSRADFNHDGHHYVAGVIGVSLTTMVTITWLVSVISVERMVAVCFPFHVSSIFTPNRMKLVILLVYAFIGVMLIPKMGSFYIDCVFEEQLNTTVLAYFERPWFVDNNWWLFFYYLNFLPPVSSTVPMVTILVGTFPIIIRLKKTQRVLGIVSTSGKNRVKEMRSVKISLVICLCMAFSILVPNACLDAYYVLGGESFHFIILLLIRDFTQLAVQINASMNFFVYVAMSSKFSKTYLKLIRCNSA
ncbi:unnamed protein product [Lymnaea stagnalis]|uniref:G-protein coupled receptors family 1 profile domain-containing protein n=1 Tax=Lymnaea stagnalis TaxID=6523 RepID=A0AAV2I2F6_LYMST